MKITFIGVIPVPTECGFGIPIYSDGNKYYHHELNDDFIITSFEEIKEDSDKPIHRIRFSLFSGREYKIGDSGILVWMNTKNSLMLVCPKEQMVQCKEFMISASGKHLREEIEKYF